MSTELIQSLFPPEASIVAKAEVAGENESVALNAQLVSNLPDAVERPGLETHGRWT